MKDFQHGWNELQTSLQLNDISEIFKLNFGSKNHFSLMVCCMEFKDFSFADDSQYYPMIGN